MPTVSAPLDQAQALLARGEHDAAVRLARAELQRDPSSGAAQLLLAIAGVMRGRPDEALAHASEAVRLCPGDARAWFALGRAHKLGHALQAAAAAYRQALVLDPGYAEAHVSLGITLKHGGDIDAAMLHYERAIVLNPALAAAHANLAYARAAQAESQATAGAGRAPAQPVLEAAARAAALAPASAELHFNLGLLLRHAGQRREAIDAFNRALGLQPSNLGYCLHLGHDLTAVGDANHAAVLYERWLQINPPAPPVMRALAQLLTREGKAGQALAWAEQAVALESDPKNWLQLCHAYQQCRRLGDSLVAGRKAIEMSGRHWEQYSVPLLVATYVLEDPVAINALHAEFGRALTASLSTAPLGPARPAARAGARSAALRVGYVSSDFIHHSVSFFMGPLLTHHDRSRIEVWCYHGRGWADGMTESLKALGHHWVDCGSMSDEALLQRIRDDGIDILIDLSGHTAGARLRVFGQGAAPLQMSYLGYPTATGVARIEYRISDAIIDPGDMPSTGSECPRCLPGSMFCYRPPERPAIVPRLAPPPGGLVFASFNNLAKLNDRTLALWARVLRAVPGSRLLIKAAAAADPANRPDIEAFMAACGVAAERLDLRSQLAVRSSHLEVYNEVDVALDSFPYNGATTTCEALWMGVPVISLKGRTHTARMGASILAAAGQPGWVADDEDHFVATAGAVAHVVPTRQRWRAEARDLLQRSSLMDEAGFTRGFEQLLLQAWADAVAAAPATT